MPRGSVQTASVSLTTSIAADAASVQSVAELATLLRQLRRREARHRDGTALTYRELAAKTGWSRGIIGEYLAGTALPPTDRFDQLIRLLGATTPEWNLLTTARDRVDELRRPARSAPPEPAAPSGRVPRELPAPVPSFVGRVSQLRELDQLTSAEAGSLIVAAICGGGGVGKTALAVHWAHRAADQFPDGQLYIDLRGYSTADPVDTGDALGRFLHALGVESGRMPSGTDARATQFRTMLAGRRMLVVLDNAVSADQVRPLLPGSPTCMVVVTSRDSLAGLVAADGAHRVELDVLNDDEALTLMRGLLGDRVDAASDDAYLLTRLCGRLPLALRVAAELANSRSDATVGELVASLRDQRSRLDVLDAGDPRCALRSVLSGSYVSVSPAAAGLFRLLACDPGPDLSLRAAASLADVTLTVGRRLMAELTRAHMIAEVAPGRFTVHDVLRAYAAERLHETDPVAEQQAATRRLLDHYLHSAVLAAKELDPSTTAIEVAPAVAGAIVTPIDSPHAATAWFATERLALLAATRLARDHGFPDHAGQLARVMADYLDREGYWQELADCHAVALEAAGTPEARARAYAGLARAAARLQLTETAREHYERACEQHGLTGDELSQALVHWRLGQLHISSGRLVDALASETRALEIFDRHGQEAGRAKALNNIGDIHALLGDCASAQSTCDESLEAWRRIGYRTDAAPTLDSLGYVFHRTGRLGDAIDYYHEALSLHQESGHRPGQAAVWTRLGDAYSDAGDEDAAREAWRTALSILDDLGHADAADVRARLAAPLARVDRLTASPAAA